LASNVQAAIAACPAAAGVVACTTTASATGCTAPASTNQVTVTDTTPGNFTTFSVTNTLGGNFTWTTPTAGTNGSNACSGPAPSFTGTYTTSNTTATLATNLKNAINLCTGAGVTAACVSGTTTCSTNQLTATDTTLGDSSVSTFTPTSNNASIFSWGSVTGGSAGSNGCSGSAPAFTGTFGVGAAGSFAAGSTSAVAANVVSAIAGCPTGVGVTVAQGGGANTNQITVTQTTPGPFLAVGGSSLSGLYSWSSVSGGSSGSNSLSCGGSAPNFTANFATSNSATTLAANLGNGATSAIGVCASQLGLSTPSATSGTVTITSSTLGTAGNHITVNAANNTGIYTWSGPTAALDGTNGCTGNTTGTFATSTDLPTLASNLATAIQACTSHTTVGVTASATGGTVSLTAATAGTGGNSISLSPTTTTNGFKWSASPLSGGTDGDNTSVGSFSFWTTNAPATTTTVASNLAAAINRTVNAGVPVTASASSNVVTVIANDPPPTGPATFTLGNNLGGMSGFNVPSSTGATAMQDTTHFAISLSTTTEASNLAATINANPTLMLSTGVTASTSGTSTVTVTANDAGASGNSIGLSKTLTNFGWTGNATALAGGQDGQESIVGLNNLYNGMCSNNTCGGPAAASNTCAVPQVAWAYKTTSAPISTSPVLSTDGKKVAYVENSSPPVFHVLAIGTTGNNGSIKGPVIPGCGTGNNACDVAIPFGATGDSISSPFPDYNTDSAFVGANDGKLYKFIDVFSGNPPGPALAPSPWPITITTAGGGSATTLTSPVLDASTRNIFIGDGAGVLHYVRDTGSTTGACASGAPPCLGTPTVNLQGAILDDGPIVDGTSQKVFEFQGGIGLGAGGVVEVVQADEALSLASVVTADFGLKKGTQEFTGTFDNAYFNFTGSGTNTGHLYVCGSDASGQGVAALWVTGFTGTTMNTSGVNGPTEVVALSQTNNSPCSPLTEFFNPNIGGGTDLLFVSVGTGCSSGDSNGCIRSFDITGGPTAIVRSGPLDEPSGTGGIVVDNISLQPGASSIYFSTLGNASSGLACGGATTGGGCGIKLTQSAFQ
jgi:hypothetical protein